VRDEKKRQMVRLGWWHGLGPGLWRWQSISVLPSLPLDATGLVGMWIGPSRPVTPGCPGRAHAAYRGYPLYSYHWAPAYVSGTTETEGGWS